LFSIVVPDADAAFDTNVLVAALRSRQGASWRILDLVRQEQVLLHVTVPLALEYEEGLLRHRQVAGWSRRETLAFLGLLLGKARRHEVHYLWRGHAHDPEDAHVLEAAIASGTGHLVTFNTGDLAAAGEFGIEVLTPGEFLRAIE
jgi:putative PIN family toxin of toxin-antitoxin system